MGLSMTCFRLDRRVSLITSYRNVACLITSTLRRNKTSRSFMGSKTISTVNGSCLIGEWSYVISSSPVS